MDPSPTPTPSPSSSTVLDYAQHISNVSDAALVVLVTLAVLVVLSLGILISRSLA